MNRREWIQGAAGLSAAFAAGGIAAPANAQSRFHPLSRLLDIDTGTYFRPEEGQFNLVLLMTAQKSYASCGSAFAAAEMVVENHGSSVVRPVFICPSLNNQTDPSDQYNLDRAKNSGANFKILSGALRDVRQTASSLGGFFDPPNGRVEGHSQEAVLLNSSGDFMYKYSYNDHITLTYEVAEIINACQRLGMPDLCR